MSERRTSRWRTSRERFRSSEIRALISLTGFLLLMLALIIATRQRAIVPAGPRPLSEAVTSPLPPPDAAPELQGLQDRSPMNARDTAAYKLLMDRVREEPHQALRSRARREIVYSQLFDDPDRYRGLPLHVEGIARRVLVQDVEGSVVFPDGRYYEVYAFTPSSQNNPYILAADEIPSELPIGDAVEVPVRFDGYFLKLMAYLAGDDKFRAAPLVVGRFQSVSSSDPLPVPASRNLRWLRYLGLALVVLLIVQGYRILRSLFGRERASELTGHSAVIDTIEPDELEAWVEREQRGLDPNEPEIADYDHPDSPENGRD